MIGTPVAVRALDGDEAMVVISINKDADVPADVKAELQQTTILGEPRGPATELRITPQATIAAVEPYGFNLRDVVEVGPYHYGAVFERQT